MHFSLLASALAPTSYATGAPSVKRQASSLEQVTDDFGDNQSGTGFYLYVPPDVKANPEIIVGVHWCTGTAQAFFQGTQWAYLADEYGFVVIYPESPYEGGCWDVSSSSALTHNGGGDSNSIANMVTYTLDKYNGNADQVFVTGVSSGAMMTNVLAATYPGMFAAASAFSGVPHGCFVSTADAEEAWNNTCATGESIAPPAYWASVVESAYPDYDGPRPRFQVWHGTADDVLYPQNYEETVKQWTGVFGLDVDAPDSVEEGVPEETYTKTVWGVSEENPMGLVEGYLGEGVGHSVPTFADEAMKWFGIGPYA